MILSGFVVQMRAKDPPGRTFENTNNLETNTQENLVSRLILVREQFYRH